MLKSIATAILVAPASMSRSITLAWYSRGHGQPGWRCRLSRSIVTSTISPLAGRESKPAAEVMQMAFNEIERTSQVKDRHQATNGAKN